MDALNRWSIALGAGALLGMVAVAGFDTYVSDARSERTGYAYNQLFPDYTTLDASVERVTYNRDEMSAFVGALVDAGVQPYIDCGWAFHPAHPCTITADIPEALGLSDSYAAVLRDDVTLTVGEYQSKDYDDVLQMADTIVADNGDGPQNVTNEGHAFTVSYTSVEPLFSSSNTVLQHGLATTPIAPLWLGVGGLATAATVFAAAGIRPTRTPEPETVGVEFFDVLTEEPKD